MWARTAESDLIIAEALLGSSLGPLTTLAKALAAALLPVPAQHEGSSSAGDAGQVDAAGTGSSSCSCLPVLARPVSAALLDQLQAARGLATCMSPAVKQLAAQVGAAGRQQAASVCLFAIVFFCSLMESPFKKCDDETGFGVISLTLNTIISRASLNSGTQVSAVAFATTGAE